MSSVTAALIVRNEAGFIADCLSSLAGRVNEIVLVDTGSRDETIEIARRFPVKLHHFSWCDDFAAARNFALQQATCDWILHIDADERLEIPSRDEYARLLSDRGKVGWALKFHWRVGWTPFSELRLFRNDPRIRFSGVIHENIWPAVEAVMAADGLDVGTCDLRMHHVGYEVDQRPKNPLYIPLLRRVLSENPDHLFGWWHLGECLRLAGDADSAETAWSAGIARLRAQADRNSLTGSLLYIALIKLRRAGGAARDDLAAEAAALFPDNLAVRFVVAHAAVERGDISSAFPILEQLAGIDGDAFFAPGFAYDKALFGHLSKELLALCHFRCGRFDEAARLYRIAAETSPAPAACELKARLAESRSATRSSSTASLHDGANADRRIAAE
jgi:tetratricopeptide (TPR) repeat protein